MPEFKWSNILNYDRNIVSQKVLSDSGIYQLLVKLQSGRYRVFYVGKADDLKKRLLEHLSENEKNECIKTEVNKYVVAFMFAYVPSEEDRKNAEFTMFNHYGRPECNDQEPEGKEIEMNFQ